MLSDHRDRIFSPSRLLHAHPPHPEMPFTLEKVAIWNTPGLLLFSFEEGKGAFVLWGCDWAT